MRYTGPIALLVILLALSGCVPVPSLYPYVEAGKGIAAPQFVGEWGPAGEHASITHDTLDVYTMILSDTSNVKLTFRVRFDQLGGRWMADAQLDMSSLRDGDLAPFAYPMHIVLRADVVGDSLRLCALDDDPLAKQVRSGQVRVRHEDLESGLVLSERTPGLRKMAARLAGDDHVFQPMIGWVHRN